MNQKLWRVTLALLLVSTAVSWNAVWAMEEAILTPTSKVANADMENGSDVA